jgi:hypothetical protein
MMRRAAMGAFGLLMAVHKAGCLPGCDDGRQLAGFYTHPDAFDEDAQVLIECPCGFGGVL